MPEQNEVNLLDIVQTKIKPIQNELDLADIVKTNLKPKQNENMNLTSLIRTKWTKFEHKKSSFLILFSENEKQTWKTKTNQT